MPVQWCDCWITYCTVLYGTQYNAMSITRGSGWVGWRYCRSSQPTMDCVASNRSRCSTVGTDPTRPEPGIDSTRLDTPKMRQSIYWWLIHSFKRLWSFEWGAVDRSNVAFDLAWKLQQYCTHSRWNQSALTVTVIYHLSSVICHLSSVICDL